MLQPSFDSGSGNGQSLIQRSPYNPAYPLASYEDDNSYHPQHPQSHTITTNVDIADGAIFGASAGGKSWYDSYPMKALHGAFSENDANNGLASSGYPFLFQHSQMTPVQTENVPAFSVTSSLSTGLTSSDRTLPNPLGYRNSTYLPEHVANSSVGPSSMLSYRPWESDKPVLNEIIIPRSGSSVTSSSRSSETSRPSPTSPSDVEFGYIPVSADLSPLVHSPSIGSTSDAMRFSDRYATIHEPRRTKGPDIYTSELYGYTTKRSSARGYTSSAHEYERNTVEYDSIPINRADLMPRLAPLSPRHNAQGI